MKPIEIISQDLFDKIRSKFQRLEMGDETGTVTIDPAAARFFDFDFVHEGVNMGRVSVSINDLGNLKIYYSRGITENQNDLATKIWFNFLKEMRYFAMRRLLRFDTRDIAKNNLERQDFQYLAKKSSKEDTAMNTMNESRWNQKSSRKTSRAITGQTEVIVRHAQPVEETLPGSRSRKKNIKAIFIQNREGERFKYPFIHTAGAFAMAQHVDHGGVPHDPAGRAIVKMSEEIAQLQEFQRQVVTTSLHDDAMGITERAMARMNELKNRIDHLGKRKYYEAWIAEFNESEDAVLGELDAVTLEDYKSKFTETNFKEELTKFFPLIHRIMQETNTVDLEEYVDEGQAECTCDSKDEPDTACPVHGKSVSEEVKTEGFNKFVEWSEAVEQGKLTDDQIEDLKKAISELPDGKLELGPDAANAWSFFSEFGLEDSDLKDKLEKITDVDPDTNAVEVLQIWAEDNYPELLVALGLSSQANTTEPAAPAQPEEPAPEEQPVAEQKSRPLIMKEVAKTVKSFYNATNENVGPFRSQEAVALEVEKKIREMFGEAAADRARTLAEKFMQKLTSEWQQRHGQTVMDGSEQQLPEMSDIQRLAGLRK
jgi:hypothetical protein